jgi:hypothetical protein
MNSNGNDDPRQPEVAEGAKGGGPEVELPTSGNSHPFVRPEDNVVAFAHEQVRILCNEMPEMEYTIMLSYIHHCVCAIYFQGCYNPGKSVQACESQGISWYKFIKNQARSIRHAFLFFSIVAFSLIIPIVNNIVPPSRLRCYKLVF